MTGATAARPTAASPARVALSACRVLTMCNLHVVMGTPLLELPSRDSLHRLLDAPDVRRRVEPLLSAR